VSLHTLVRPETWRRLTTITKDRILQPIIDRMEPWFVAFVTVHLSAPRDRLPPGRQPAKTLAACGGRRSARGIA